ncbi:MAG TPA: NmrA family transcriptional regulator [Bryobacteraceae bacterium]|nr:NmrA family transcriptional regulator [Bryobacteraceae bacterium]
MIGGTGLVGSRAIAKLKACGHEAVVAAPSTGVNTLTGEGVAAALKNASAVVDVSNSPSFDEKAVMEFFQIICCPLERRGGKAPCRVIGGRDRTAQESHYMRAKIVQETLIKESGIPYSIVHATQFFEFVKSIADAATVGSQVHVPSVFIKPNAAQDVASAVAQVAVGAPLNAVLEVAGPERFRFDEFIGRGLRARNGSREVVVDPDTPYFGAKLGEVTLIESGEARIRRDALR